MFTYWSIQVVYDFFMVYDIFVLSDKMFWFGVVCHMVRDGDGNVLVDALYDGGGFYPVIYIEISEQGVSVSCLISMMGKGFLTVF